jgi:oligopeptide transport system permease protein
MTSNDPQKTGYTSLRIEGDNGGPDGKTWYTYAVKNQTGYKVRVHYYEYFRYMNGFEPIFYFGTNIYGQDIFACLAYAGRLSFLLAFSVSFINFIIGAIYGAIEGYYGGAIDMLMERFTDILARIPFMVVATLFQLHLAKQVGPVISLLFAFVLTGWIGMASTVRMQFYRFKGQEYVLAARVLGASDWRIMFRHIFPNSLGTIVTSSVLVIPGVIFSESSLTYLGIVNLDSSTMTSVGTMLANGKEYLSSYPHVIFFPALFISLLMISFNLFGNGLRDAFNPSLRGADE